MKILVAIILGSWRVILIVGLFLKILSIATEKKAI